MRLGVLEWERDPHVAKGIVSTWTNALIVGEGPEDFYDMCVVGDPDCGRAVFDVTGRRDGKPVTFAKGRASSWDEACRLAVIEARRASIRLTK
ncbi:hypothetical protein [Rhizobium sp. IMFF44]|uniref:hypothetical protein n=1 Tax=Rhizobium sp. IMFF44 TaxID=3342350 RepID=UPI0035BA2202